MRLRTSSGFSLIELAIVVLVMGIMVAIAVPSFVGYRRSQALKGAAFSIASDLRLARERAIAQRIQVLVHYHGLSGNSNWHYHDYPSGAWIWGGKFPQGVSLVSAGTPYFQPDGRSTGSAHIILQDQRGVRDTVSVLTSGLVLAK
jgi:type II secretion system protein H